MVFGIEPKALHMLRAATLLIYIAWSLSFVSGVCTEAPGSCKTVYARLVGRRSQRPGKEKPLWPLVPSSMVSIGQNQKPEC